MLQPPDGVPIEQWEQCKFTSKAFKDQVIISVEGANEETAAVPDMEPSFDWVNPEADVAKGIPAGEVALRKVELVVLLKHVHGLLLRKVEWIKSE